MTAVVASGEFVKFRNELHARFEDGTINFLNILALEPGLKFFKETLGGMSAISECVVISNSSKFERFRFILVFHKGISVSYIGC